MSHIDELTGSLNEVPEEEAQYEPVEEDQEEDEVGSKPPEISPLDDDTLGWSLDAEASVSIEMKPTNEVEENDQTKLFARLAEHEDSTCAARWANLDYMPHRILHLLTTFRWMRSHGDPSKDLGTIRRSYFKEDFLDGFLFIAGSSIQIGILLLVIVQIANAVSFRDVLDLLKGGDRRVLTIALYGAAKSRAFRDSLVSLFALPFLWGLVRGIVGCLRVEVEKSELNPRVEEAYRYLQTESRAQIQRSTWKHLWHDGLRWFLPLHPVSRSVLTISHALRWDARLDPLLRQRAQTALINIFETSYGYTKLTTGYEIVRIIDSAHRIRLVDDEYVLLGDGLSLFQTRESVSINSRSTGGMDSEQDMASQEHLFNRTLKERAIIDVLNFATWPGQQWESSSFFAKGAILTGFLYGRYLQWWIGLAPTTKESAAFWTFKIGKLAYSMLLLRSVYLAFRDYINCPDKPGVTFTGIAPWAGKFDNACLQATIEEFNRFPGQQADTLLKLLTQFHLSEQEKQDFTLDLRDKDLNASTIAEIINGFVDRGYTISSLWLGGNLLRPHEREDPSGVIALSRAISRLSQLKLLDLSTNYCLGGCYLDYRDCLGYNTSGLVALGEAFLSLPHLETLDLSTTLLGYCDRFDPRGTEAIGRGFQGLKRLKRLKLADNYIGFNDHEEPRGTIALGNGFATLPQLTHLNISFNYVGFGDCDDTRGTEAVGLGLGSIPSLRSLDMSRMSMSQCDRLPQGMTAIARGIAAQKSLRELYLDNAPFTFDNIEAMETLARGIGEMRQLTALNLNNLVFGSAGNTSNTLGEAFEHLTELQTLGLRLIGLGEGDMIDPSATIAIAKGIRNCRRLRYLDLSDNTIGGSDDVNAAGTMELGKALGALRQLEFLTLSSTGIGKRDYINPEGTLAIVQGLGRLRSLKSLDLSNTAFGLSLNESSTNVVELVRSLSSLTQLREFRLLPSPFLTSKILAKIRDTVSKLPNHIYISPILEKLEDIDEFFDQTSPTERTFKFSNSFFDGIRASPNPPRLFHHFFERLSEFDVQYLDLSKNKIGTLPAPHLAAMATGLARLTQLVTLDLSENTLGWQINSDLSGYIALGEALGQMKDLKLLNLSTNIIGSSPNITAVMMQHLAPPELVVLDLASNRIGECDLEDMQALGMALKRMPALQFLDLSGSRLGWYDDAEPTVALADGIGSLTQLRVLNMSNNYLGLGDDVNPAGTIALGNAIGQLTGLRYLDLSSNSIGRGTADGELGVVTGIAKLRNLCSLELSFNEIGSTDNRAPRMLLDYLPTVNVFAIRAIQNISWTETAEKMSQIISKLLRSNCESKICFGADIKRQDLTCDAQRSYPSAFVSEPGSGFATLLEAERGVVWGNEFDVLGDPSHLGTHLPVNSLHRTFRTEDSLEVAHLEHEIREYFVSFTLLPFILMIVSFLLWRLGVRVSNGPRSR